MACIRVAGGFACGRAARGKTQTICDACNRAVNKHESPFPWRGRSIDLCNICRDRYSTDPKFAAWADPIIVRHLAEEIVG